MSVGSAGAEGYVLVVEPYFGGSHRAWAEGLRTHLSARIELLTLPAEAWQWRMRGGAATLAEMCGGLSSRPEAVLVSDMIDLAAFRVLARPHLGDTPTALYFHESQFTYPISPRMTADRHYALTNWMSALSADHIYFNSHYHREVFFEEVERFMRQLPEPSHLHLVDEVARRSDVLEVGVDLDWVDRESGPRGSVPRVVWNHRWEHDKDPEALFAAVDQLASEGLDFELVVCGESPGHRPAVFSAAAERHPDRIVHMGFLDLDEYRSRLLQSDIVVSTARQEFFGVAVVEAMAAGCFPVLPDRLSYRELVPERFHDLCLYCEGGLSAALRHAIEGVSELAPITAEIGKSMRRYGWDVMAPRYDRALATLVKTQGAMA